MSNPILEVNNLTFSYKNGSYPVLRDISFTLGRGEILILSGPSGSGKSTLISLIGLLRRAPRNAVTLCGTDVGACDANTLLGLRRRLRFIFQKHYLLDSLNVLQNVASGIIPQMPHDVSSRTALARRVLTSMELGDKAAKWPNELSGGEQQRVAVARALVSNPDLLLADEPTASLDYPNARRVVDAIARHAREHGCSVILATHDTRIMDIGTRQFDILDGQGGYTDESPAQQPPTGARIPLPA